MVHFNRLKRYNDDRDDFYERSATIPDAKVDDGQQKVDSEVSTDEWYSIQRVTTQKKGKSEGLLPSCVGGRYASMASIGRCH